jgi:MFS family permease
MFYVLLVSLATFQFGWNNGVINQPRASLTAEFPSFLHDLTWGFFVSVYILGGILGGLAGGHLASIYGRKPTLVFNNGFFLVGGCIFYWSSAIFELCIARFLVGVGSGISTALVPVYINELSPIESRGSYGSINQLSIVLGVLLSQVAGIYFVDDWRTLFLLTIVPSTIQLLLVRSLPESPRWLLKHVGRDEAFHALARLRNEDAEMEFEGLCADNSDIPPMSFGEVFKAKELRIPLASVFVLQVAQQVLPLFLNERPLALMSQRFTQHQYSKRNFPLMSRYGSLCCYASLSRPQL